MNLKLRLLYWKSFFFILIITVFENKCHEKTLRKIVRNQSKMVQRPFSETDTGLDFKSSKQHVVVYPGYAQIKSIVHKRQRPIISTILTSTDMERSKPLLPRNNMDKNEISYPFDLRMARDAVIELQQKGDNVFRASAYDVNASTRLAENLSNPYKIPSSIFFPMLEEKATQSMEQETPDIFSDKHSMNESNLFIRPDMSSKETIIQRNIESDSNDLNLTASLYYDTDGKTDFVFKYGTTKVTLINNNSMNMLLSCAKFNEAITDIDAQEKYTQFDIEPPWIANKHFWNHVYESRYETLMKNAKWPALKVILIPRTHVDSIWKQPFENVFKSSTRKIISNIVKKLQFYSNLTFSWNEVSHLSHWWKGAGQKSRTALRKLIEEGRLEITTGLWVETDEATSHLFGILHQLVEGHQWLLYNLNYFPEVAWLTKSVTHSPTLPYLLSASGISRLVITNLHFSWEQYLTEYQYTDFVWVQSWDDDKTAHTNLNVALNRIGNDRFPMHSVITHYLPFNSDGFKACGPQGDICETDFKFIERTDHQDINTFNVKEQSEKLLEQYSKTGTTSSHNVIISPLGGEYRYSSQTEFDLQYNNYQKIADYININHNIYKATIEFGTTKNYFENILTTQNSFPTLKGDFLNFADISDGTPAYWSGYFTSRPLFKIVLRRLHSTLRSTEILFAFALNSNAFNSYKVSTLYEPLLNAREVVARLQDRNVVGGTLTAKALSYVQHQIIHTARDCWHIQETAASLLSSKPPQNETYLEKYLYREGEFMTSYKSITPGDQIYVFNSLNHERVEVVELIARHPNISIVDHIDKEMQTQINPVWKFGFEKIIRISSQFFKITFVARVPPLAFVLFKIKEIQHAMQNAATIYCTSCIVDKVDDRSAFLFDMRPLETGDIQLENYKHRLIIDEYTGCLKTVTKKSGTEIPIIIDFGAFKSANIHSGIFLFNTNVSKPMEDILSPFMKSAKSRAVIIVSGQITTELTVLYGNFLHHTVKIFNIINSPLSDVIKLETKIDYDVEPNHKEMDMFMSIQTGIINGSPPEFFIDNNGFHHTPRTINTSRRVESNVYPFTSMTYIQDQKTRLTVITDHAQGVTVLQEGQLVVMLDRWVLLDDNRGSNEGINEHSATTQSLYLLIENFIEPKSSYDDVISRSNLKLPSHSASYLANVLNYNLDIYFIDSKRTHLCHYAFMPLVKTPFPCDVTLINYRAVLNRGIPEKYTPNTALMTLHRQRYSCRVENENHPQCSGESSLKLDNIFRKIRAVYQTNLVGTTEGVAIKVLNNNNFPPMKLTTLRIYF